MGGGSFGPRQISKPHHPPQGDITTPHPNWLLRYVHHGHLKKNRAFYMPRFSFGGNLKISESIILLLEKSMKLEKSEFLSIF